MSVKYKRSILRPMELVTDAPLGAPCIVPACWPSYAPPPTLAICTPLLVYIYSTLALNPALAVTPKTCWSAIE